MTEVISSAIGFFLDALGLFLGIFHRVTVTTHAGYLVGSADKQVFVNISNRSLNRDVEIGAVWFEAGKKVPVTNEARPLPKRLKPSESWETWIPLHQLRAVPPNVMFRAARVRVSGGKVISSRRNKTVPPSGSVPG